MTAFQEPLEKGWLRTVLNEVRREVDGWPSPSSPPNRTEEKQNEPVERFSSLGAPTR